MELIDYKELRPQSVVDVIEVAGRLPSSTVIIAGGERVEDLQLVESARDHGIVERIILVGHKESILRSMDGVGIDVPEHDIIHADGMDNIAARTVEKARAGGVDILLKGRVTTSVLSHHMLKLANRPTASLVTLLDAATLAGGRPMLMTDPAITTVLNFGRLCGLIRNAVDVAHAVLDIPRPRVALLSAYEGVLPSLPSTRIALELANLDWPNAVVCGPLSFDLATNAAALGVKGLPDLPNASEVAGQADILVCPSIEAGNILYKCLSAQVLFGLASLANIAVGFDVSYGIISRADALETRLISIALCSVFAQRSRMLGKRKKAVFVSLPSRNRILTVRPHKQGLGILVSGEAGPVYSDDLACDWIQEGGAEYLEDKIFRLADRVKRNLEEAKQNCVDAVVCGNVFLPESGNSSPDGFYWIAQKKPEEIVVDGDLVESIFYYALKTPVDNLSVPLAARLAQILKTDAWMVFPYKMDPKLYREALDKGRTYFESHIRPMALVDEAVLATSRASGLETQTVEPILAYLDKQLTVITVKNGVVESSVREEISNRSGSVVEQVASVIGAAFTAGGMRAPSIVLAGELAWDKNLNKEIRRLVSRLAPVLSLDSEEEMRMTSTEALSLIDQKKQAEFFHFKIG